MKLIFIILFCLCACTNAVTQPVLKILSSQRIGSKLYVNLNVLCDGFKQFDLKKSDFEITENGFPVTDFEISCPPVQECCKTLGLAAEIYMGSGYWKHAEILNAFVDKMQSCDEAAYIFMFRVYTNSETLQVKVPITYDKSLLKKAIGDSLASGQGCNVTKLIIGAIQEAVKGHNNPCKAVVLWTSSPGYPNCIKYSYQQAIDTARKYGYSVYCIMEGPLVNLSLYDPLKVVSDQTGGVAFGPIDLVNEQGDSLLIYYSALVYDLITNQNKFCTLSYELKCKDGGQRNVEITVNKCGGQTTKSVTYTAPYDRNSFVPIIMKLNQVTVIGGQSTDLQLTHSIPIVQDVVFAPALIRIRYDPICVTFSGVDSSTGIFKGRHVTFQSTPGSITITSPGAFILPTEELFTTLRFQASDPQQDIECQITIDEWRFTNGCIFVQLEHGKISINTRKPILDCMLELPDSLLWDRTLNNYTPNPFLTSITINNLGNREARNVKAKITLPSDNSLILAGPTIDTQPTTPALIKTGDMGSATWFISARERLKGDSLQVCIETWADNHPPIQCCKKIYIPVVGARLTCSLSVDKIKVDTKLNRYTPMPFTIIDTVKNTGGLPTDTVFTTIILPQGLTLANVPNNSQIKRAQPIKLNSQMSGTASWQLYHSITIEEKKYTVTICNRTGYPSLREKNADSVCCDVDIIIPQIDAPVLECTVTAVDSLFYDEVKDTYNPNPFPFTVAVKNNGSLDADSVRATIVLPPEFVLESPTQPKTKYFNPMLVIKYTPTLPANEVTWMVKALDQKKRKASEIKVKLNGVMR